MTDKLLLDRLNARALEIIGRYRNISVGKVCVETPYFINTAELHYKEAMLDAGVSRRLVDETIKRVKNGRTPLGSGAGKGSPKEISGDLARLVKFLRSRKIRLPSGNSYVVREWMKESHIGVDCSGFVYNVLAYALKGKSWEKARPLLAWEDRKRMDAARASVLIYKTPKLLTVENMRDIQPLDVVTRGWVHNGIVVRTRRGLELVDSSIYTGGITFNPVVNVRENSFSLEGRPDWHREVSTGNFVVKRFPVLDVLPSRTT